MPPALVVLAGIEDAAVARAESHYNPRSNSEHCHHINFSMVSGYSELFIAKNLCHQCLASGTTFVFAWHYHHFPFA